MKHLLLLFALLALPCAAHAAGPDLPGMDSNAPVAVSADNMVYEPAKNTVIFTGNVEVKREAFQMWSQELTLFLRKEGQKTETTPQAEGEQASPVLNNGNLERIIARKNVRFKYNTQTGSAQKATYTVDSGLLLLEGDPVIHDGDNSIRGNVIRYHMNENRSEVVGTPKKRVEAIFTPNAKGK